MLRTAINSLVREIRSSMQGFTAAWGALAVAMPLGYVGFVLALDIVAFVRTGSWAGFPIQMIVAVMAAFAFCLVLGPVFLLFRRLIIGPTLPFLRWGYVVVPALGLVAAWNADPYFPKRPVELLEAFLLFFQGPALVGTLVYVWLARRWGGFANERSTPAAPWPSQPAP